MQRVEFMVAGSKGDLYRVIFELNNRNMNAFCSCKAGQNGTYCKHRFALMDGDVTDLISENSADVDKLRTMLRGTDVEMAYINVANAQKVADNAKKALRNASRDLAKAIYHGTNADAEQCNVISAQEIYDNCKIALNEEKKELAKAMFR